MTDNRNDDRMSFPTWDDIAKVEDLEVLYKLLNDVQYQAQRIEVDLTTIIDPDEDWSARARGALTHAKVSIKALHNRIKHLTGGGGTQIDREIEKQKLKLQKKAASAEQAKTIASTQKDLVRKKEISLENSRMNLLRETDYFRIFRRSTRLLVSPEMFLQIEDMTEEVHSKRLSEQVMKKAVPV